MHGVCLGDLVLGVLRHLDCQCSENTLSQIPPRTRCTALEILLVQGAQRTICVGLGPEIGNTIDGKVEGHGLHNCLKNTKNTKHPLAQPVSALSQLKLTHANHQLVSHHTVVYSRIKCVVGDGNAHGLEIAQITLHGSLLGNAALWFCTCQLSVKSQIPSLSLALCIL